MPDLRPNAGPLLRTGAALPARDAYSGNIATIRSIRGFVALVAVVDHPCPVPVGGVVDLLLRHQDALVLGRVPEDVHGIAPVPDRGHRLVQHPAQLDHPDVRLAEALAGAVGDRGLRDPRHEVLHERDLQVQPAVHVERYLVVGDGLLRGDLGLRGELVAGVDDVEGAVVVDGHAVLELGARRAGGGAEDVGEHPRVPDPPDVVVLARSLDDAALEDAVCELGEADAPVRAHHRASPRRDLLARLLGQIPAVDAVQPLGVHRIGRVLLALEPVARQFGEPDVPPGVRGDEQVPSRHERRGLRAEVGEEEPAELLDRIAGDPDLLLESPVRMHGLLEGLFDAPTGLVHHPAVVHAPQAVRLRDAVGEIDPSVRAVAVDEPDGAGSVLVEDEVLAEESDGLGGALVELGGRCDGGASSGASTRPSACPARPG